jgi:group I intron endonuclease
MTVLLLKSNDLTKNTSLGVVYKITNPKGRIYIGQTVNFERRISEYERLHCKDQPGIFNSLKKYGSKNHTIEMLEICDVNFLNKREGYYQDLYNSVKNGLNCVRVSDNESSGYASEETKLKISNALKEKYKKEIFHWTGKKHNQYTINKIKENSTNAKLVLDFDTGIFYISALEASKAKCIHYSKLRSWLNGTNKNKSNLKYV